MRILRAYDEEWSLRWPTATDSVQASLHSFMEELRALGSGIQDDDSLRLLRKFLVSGFLRQTDVRDDPRRFLAVHGLLAQLSIDLGPGFWIRFMVQFNLFAGSVVALGSPEQVACLDGMQAEEKVGCFALTEVFAGVSSGLVVNTTCTWEPERQVFVLHCPDEGSQKNWISQGFSADLAVVVADFRLGGKSYGPHAFLMELRQNGVLVDGVHVRDMGPKTVGNDLDNARIAFDSVVLPRDSLLSRYASIAGRDDYIRHVAGIRPLDMIGQRLYTGRTVIARSALVFARALFGRTLGYSDSKRCWAPGGRTFYLSEVPQLRSLFAEADSSLARLEHFVSRVEELLADCLIKEESPPDDLILAIATAKVKTVEVAIDLCHRLKQDVGSYALVFGSGFEQLDYLQCCKFAEGDSRILMQKISRDRVREFQRGSFGSFGSPEQTKLCDRILRAPQDSPGPHGMLPYELAHEVMDRVIVAFVGPQSKL